ncbi:neurofilament heavy polypeptide-like [Mercenaria mercenaria]|uniref:neurofilament heavy polypeptide-like n=1 Tax=Mercenaria mercenaria TaxID=6596 RepID=UPI00234EAA82|nr:neurofilament heavy polypeptide-like [Mercenaria mercenaria]
MFGRKPKLPIDALFQLEQEDSMSTNYVKDLQNKLETSREIANRSLEKARNKQKHQFDKKAKAVQINIGDTVLVKILAFDGKHKIADRFEEEVYQVVEQPSKEIPVFIVKAPDGKVRRLHRNHLLPVKMDREIPDIRPDPNLQNKTSEDTEGIARRKEIASKSESAKDTEQKHKETDSESDVEVVYTSSRKRLTGQPRSKHIEKEIDGASGRQEDKTEEKTDTGMYTLKKFQRRDKKVEVLSVDTEVDEPSEDDVALVEESSEEELEEVEEGKRPREYLVHETDEEDRPPPRPPPKRKPNKEQVKRSPRRSSRPKKEPIWYKDYQVGQKKLQRDSCQLQQLLDLHTQQAKVTAELLSKLNM